MILLKKFQCIGKTKEMKNFKFIFLGTLKSEQFWVQKDKFMKINIKYAFCTIEYFNILFVSSTCIAQSVLKKINSDKLHLF